MNTYSLEKEVVRSVDASLLAVGVSTIERETAKNAIRCLFQDHREQAERLRIRPVDDEEDTISVALAGEADGERENGR